MQALPHLPHSPCSQPGHLLDHCHLFHCSCDWKSAPHLILTVLLQCYDVISLYHLFHCNCHLLFWQACSNGGRRRPAFRQKRLATLSKLDKSNQLRKKNSLPFPDENNFLLIVHRQGNYLNGLGLCFPPNVNFHPAADSSFTQTCTLTSSIMGNIIWLKLSLSSKK